MHNCGPRFPTRFMVLVDEYAHRMINFSDTNGETGKSRHHPNLPNSTPLIIQNSRFPPASLFPSSTLVLTSNSSTASSSPVDRSSYQFPTIFIRKINYLERPPTRSPSDADNPGSIRLTKLYLAPISSARKLRVLESLSRTINEVKEALNLSTISAVTRT